MPTTIDIQKSRIFNDSSVFVGSIPRCSMFGIFTYIWPKVMVNVGIRPYIEHLGLRFLMKRATNCLTSVQIWHDAWDFMMGHVFCLFLDFQTSHIWGTMKLMMIQVCFVIFRGGLHEPAVQPEVLISAFVMRDAWPSLWEVLELGVEGRQLFVVAIVARNVCWFTDISPAEMLGVFLDPFVGLKERMHPIQYILQRLFWVDGIVWPSGEGHGNPRNSLILRAYN